MVEIVTEPDIALRGRSTFLCFRVAGDTPAAWGEFRDMEKGVIRFEATCPCGRLISELGTRVEIKPE